jgi:hypothetical protein
MVIPIPPMNGKSINKLSFNCAKQTNNIFLLFPELNLDGATNFSQM